MGTASNGGSPGGAFGIVPVVLGSASALGEAAGGGKVDWAEEFDTWVGDKIAAGDAQALAHYREQAPNAALAHPSEEHFLPLLVAMGAASNGNSGGKGRRIHDSFNLGSLSMASYEWGA